MSPTAIRLVENTPPKSSPSEDRIFILGSKRAGKEALIRRIACDSFSPHYDPTGGEYRSVSVIGREKFMFVFTPIIEETMMSYWVNNGNIWSLKNIGIILLYDITSKESFIHLENICGRLLALRISSGGTSAQADKVNQSATDKGVNDSLAAIMVGAKSDLESGRQVEYAQGRALAAKFGCSFLEVSSKSGSNAARVFDDLVRLMRQHREQPKSTAPGEGLLALGGKVGRQCTIV